MKSICCAIAAFAALAACGQTAEDANEDSTDEASGGTGGSAFPSESLPFLDGDAARKVGAPNEHGECPTGVATLQIDGVEEILREPAEKRRSIRLAEDLCGGLVVARERAGVVRVERFSLDGTRFASSDTRETFLTEKSPNGYLGALGVSRTGAAVVQTWNPPGATLDIFQADGSGIDGTDVGDTEMASSLVERPNGSWIFFDHQITVLSLPSQTIEDGRQHFGFYSPTGDMMDFNTPGVLVPGQDQWFVASWRRYNDGARIGASYCLPTRWPQCERAFSDQSATPPAALTLSAASASHAILGVTRRDQNEFLEQLNWTQSKDSVCLSFVAEVGADQWRWSPDRCDLIVGAHAIEFDTIVLHFEWTGTAWVPWLTRLSRIGEVRDSVSLADAIPDLNPFFNATGFNQRSVDSVLPAKGDVMTIAGLEKDGGNFWVGRFNWRSMF